ncbi:hypothetical protein LAD67_16190 [Escherichia coli]|nr:hypothetical protein [Escherichia coli]
MHCGYIRSGDAFGALSGRNFSPHRRPIKSLNARMQIRWRRRCTVDSSKITGDILNSNSNRSYRIDSGVKSEPLWSIV